MFPFFIIHDLTGDTNWRDKFEIALRKTSQSFAKDWPRVANYGVTAVAHAVLHPESRPRLVDVPLQVTADGRGGVELSDRPKRTHCTTTQVHRGPEGGGLVVSILSKTRFDWIPIVIAHGSRPGICRICPDPAPPAPGKDFCWEGMDPAKTWDYVLRVYLPKEKTGPPGSQN